MGEGRKKETTALLSPCSRVYNYKQATVSSHPPILFPRRDGYLVTILMSISLLLPGYSAIIPRQTSSSLFSFFPLPYKACCLSQSQLLAELLVYILVGADVYKIVCSILMLVTITCFTRTTYCDMTYVNVLTAVLL